MVVYPLIKRSYPFQISVYHVRAMHVLQAVRNIGQLNGSVAPVSKRGSPATHELDTINPSMPLHKLVYIAVIHPLGHHCKPLRFQVHTKQR